jgi:hypothetical protein
MGEQADANWQNYKPSCTEEAHFDRLFNYFGHNGCKWELLMGKQIVRVTAQRKTKAPPTLSISHAHP